MVRHPFIHAMMALAAAASTGAAGAQTCAGSCRDLVREAGVLQAQGRFAAALDKLQAASAAEPKASVPLSAQAAVLVAAAAADPAHADALRARARAQAQAALRLAPDDPVAQEALRVLDTAAPSPLHRPNGEAARALGEAEALFARQDYDGAAARYRAAMRLDPQASFAWVGAGDCAYMRKDWPQAETLFHQAVEVEPRNAQAWRFLADTYIAEDKRDAAERALEGGIAADPAALPDWTRLAQLRQAGGHPMTQLHFQRGTRVVTGADGKAQIQVDADLQKRGTAADNGMRLALALSEANARKDAAQAGTPYDIELQAWRGALKIIDEIEAKGEPGPSDPALRQMRALARDGDLEPAILLLLYRESFRPALEAWLQGHPDGVQRFVERHGLRP